MAAVDLAGMAGQQTTGEPVELLALYLPQFHPIPENDEFWGAGFTEWTSTASGRPRFPGHRQPRVAGEMGTYDLRLPAVAYQQESLATEYGIDAFVYYHYWFHGRRVMGGPLDAKLADPDRVLRFALCWANHDWNRNQNGQPPQVLIEQTYSEADDLAHSEFLANAFADPRYLRTGDRPVFFMYRTQEHPAPERFANLLRSACSAIGVSDPYLIRFETNGSHEIDPAQHSFDAGADLHPHWLWHTATDHRPERLTIGMPEDFWMRYDSVAAASSARSIPSWKRFPCVVPDWDTTSRKPFGGANALHGSSVIGYETWLAREIAQQQRVSDCPRFVVLNAWNEWSECGYLEPDAEQGRALLEATARAKGIAAPLAEPPSAPYSPSHAAYDLGAVELVPTSGAVLEVGSGHLRPVLEQRGNTVTTVDIDLDRHVLSERLRGRQFDCIVLANVLEHVRSPTRVLTDALSLLAPGGRVVISVGNIAHIDARLMLLHGQWTYQPTSLLDDSLSRFFTRNTLLTLLCDCGLTPLEWRNTEVAAFGADLRVSQMETQKALVALLLSDPDATTHRFIVSARRDRGADQLSRPVAAPTPIDLPGSDEAHALRRELETFKQLRILRVARLPRAIYRRLRKLFHR